MIVPEKKIELKNGIAVTLKSALAKDSEAVLQHLKITHRESYRNLNQGPSHWENVSIEDEAKFLGDMETGKNKFMILAWLDGKVIGGLGLFAQAAEYVKHNATLGMSIQNEFCNSGLGTQLMTMALENAKRIGLHRVDLTVRTYNTAGIKLYEKVGFKRIGLLKEIAFIDGQFVDEFAYQLIL